MRNIILNLLLLQLIGCKQEDILINDQHQDIADNDPAKILWQYPLLSDTGQAFSIIPFLYKNGIAISSVKTWGSDVNMYMVDTSGKSLIWKSNEAFNINCSEMEYLPGNGTFVYDHYYMGMCNGDPRVIDLNNGSVLWTYDCPIGRLPFLTNYNNKAFMSWQTGVNPFYSGTVMMTDIYTGNWDSIYTVDMVDDYSVGIMPPAIEVNANNDTILYFQNRQWFSPPYDGKVGLYCYNMTKDTLLWWKEDVDDNSAIYPPLLFNGMLYLKANYSVICFDPLTGEIIWTWTIDDAAQDMMYTNLLVVDGNIIVKTSAGTIYALNASNGGVIWQNLNAGYSCSDMVYFDGIIYYGSDADGKLYAINATNGETVWTMNDPNADIYPTQEAMFGNTPVIDPILHRLYITDYYYLICIQLN